MVPLLGVLIKFHNMILVINAGSSSIKTSLYTKSKIPELIFNAQIQRIGFPDCSLIYKIDQSSKSGTNLIGAIDYDGAIKSMLSWLKTQVNFNDIEVVVHRIVHGMTHKSITKITTELLIELKQITRYDPDHLPNELKIVDTVIRLYPEIKQYACFDTEFHRTIPEVARILPIPARFRTQGIERYGFHGLSFSYLMYEIEIKHGKALSKGKIILAHLGNGVSLAAIKDGNCIDTSMGFTPASGLLMSTRGGDMDPGVAWYMMEKEKLTPMQFNNIINHECGIIAVSGTSSDINDLIEIQHTDKNAERAMDLFCYQIKKCIGSYSAILGGLDMLVFSGGIGEHIPQIRERICKGLDFLGIVIDEDKNNNNDSKISSNNSKVQISVMHTDEEFMMAKKVSQELKITSI